MEVQIESYMALRDSDTYLTDEKQDRTAFFFHPSVVQGNGYRRLTVSTGRNTEFLSANADEATGAGYTFVQAGAFYGADPSLSGSWLGMSSYLLSKGNMTKRSTSF